MIIKKACVSDIPDILFIYNYEVINSTSTFDLEPKTAKDFLEYFDQHDDKHPIYVIKDGSDCVKGWGSLSKFSNKEGYKICVENSIYIHPDNRNKGYGRLMLKFLIERAKEFGYKSIIAKICSENINSINLHKSFGFEEAGLLKNVGFKFGKFLDVVILQLIL